MHLLEIQEGLKEQWDLFVQRNAPDGGILQSWIWGEFQKELQRKIFRVGFVDSEGEFIAVALVIKFEMPFEHSYLYCPRGPVINRKKVSDMTPIFNEIKKLAAAEKSFMIRIDPAWPLSDADSLTSFGYRKSDQEVQPKSSFIIDIAGDDKALLGKMKPKTRYNIGLAQKKEVTMRMSQEPSDVEYFWKLIKETSERNHFSPHPKEYYKMLFQSLGSAGFLYLALAEYDGNIIAAHFVSFFGSMATYLHGASSAMYRGVMAPALLQWESILEAKKRNCTFFDFGGAVSPHYDNESWRGISEFKYGFSPETPAQEYIGSHEQVVNPVIYSMYKFVKQIRG